MHPRAKCEHGCCGRSPNLRGPEKWNSNRSQGLGCSPVQWLRVFGDSSSGHTLPTALFAQNDLSLPSNLFLYKYLQSKFKESAGD